MKYHITCILYIFVIYIVSSNTPYINVYVITPSNASNIEARMLYKGVQGGAGKSSEGRGWSRRGPLSPAAIHHRVSAGACV